MINPNILPDNLKAIRNEFLNKLNKNFVTNEFSFIEESHKYFYKKKELTSATTFIKRFYKAFDTKNEASKYAIKRGLNVQDVLDDWENKGHVARVLGTAVHKWLEDYWMGLNPAIPEDTNVAFRIKEYIRFHEYNFMNFIPVVQEMRIFSEKYGISGTIDSIFMVEVEEDVWEFQIWDWKTNKDNKFTTDEDFTFNKSLLFPFEHLKDNEHNKYSLQISLYKILLNEVGINIGDCFLCHIPPSGNIKVHQAKNLTSILRNYLDKKSYSFLGTPTDLF